MDNKQKRIALITGASGNLGKAVADKFIKENYFVTGTVTQKDETILNYAEDKFKKINVDLTDEDAATICVELIMKTYDRIDAAVLTVGGFEMGAIANTKTSDILNQYKLNFETAYNVARPVFMQMLKQNSGRIFLIGSKPGLNAKNSKGMIAYGLSKSLLFRLAELMNNEAKGKNVKVYVVVPSIIDTPQNRKAMPGADFNKWQKPADIADIIFQHTSGANFDVDNYIIEV